MYTLSINRANEITSPYLHQLLSLAIDYSIRGYEIDLISADSGEIIYSNGTNEPLPYVCSSIKYII